MPVDVTENYIRVRMKDPDLFQEGSFRTIDISADKGIKAVIGKLEGETTTTVQAYLFDKEKWTKERAVAWVKEHKSKKAIKSVRLKAVGDWELDVLGVPFGNSAQRDAHGQYFDAFTDLHLERYAKPAVHYYHGFTPEGYPQGNPVEIGEVQSSEVREDGVWYRIILDKAKEFAKRVMEAAKRNLARASSGTADHLIRVSRDGHITNWPVIEISLFDIDESINRVPANNYAVAIPVMKALFERAGIEYPDNLPEENEPETKARGEKHRAEVAQRALQVRAKAKLYLLEDDDGS